MYLFVHSYTHGYSLSPRSYLVVVPTSLPCSLTGSKGKGFGGLLNPHGRGEQKFIVIGRLYVLHTSNRGSSQYCVNLNRAYDVQCTVCSKDIKYYKIGSTPKNILDEEIVESCPRIVYQNLVCACGRYVDIEQNFSCRRVFLWLAYDFELVITCKIEKDKEAWLTTLSSSALTNCGFLLCVFQGPPF